MYTYVVVQYYIQKSIADMPYGMVNGIADIQYCIVNTIADRISFLIIRLGGEEREWGGNTVGQCCVKYLIISQ